MGYVTMGVVFITTRCEECKAPYSFRRGEDSKQIYEKLKRFGYTCKICENKKIKKEYGS